MNKLKRLMAVLAVLTGIFGSQSAHAGVPVIDAANLVQSIMEVISWLQQADQMVQQIQQFDQQINNLATMTTKLDGIRSLGTILNNPLIKSTLPDEMQTASTLMSGGAFSGARLSNLNSVLSAYGVQTSVGGIPVNSGQAQADALSKMQQILTSAQTRSSQVDDLAARVDTTADAKDSMDMLNRNSLEQTRVNMDLTQTVATIEANRQASALRDIAQNQQQLTTMQQKAQASAAALGL